VTVSSQEFLRILHDEAGELLSSQIERISAFRDLVVEENKIQNLTRLLDPRSFFEGHVLDVLELERSEALSSRNILDLGAGMGVPGVLHAIIYPEREISWVSSDSEKMKTEFSRRVVEKFSLNSVRITHLRAEDFLDTHSGEPFTVVSRAVGTVSKIYSWISRCSTWNKLVLLKGPRWEEEWTEFQRSGKRNQLSLSAEHRYTVGEEMKKRVIVSIERKK
jgi:16S rRNA (guanine527-N7)-methyltransferase